jgi:hypothetical protein
LNAVFLEWMEQLQKCVQVDGEYAGWAKRTPDIEIDFNCEICLCYTWRGTPSINISTDINIGTNIDANSHTDTNMNIHSDTTGVQ